MNNFFKKNLIKTYNTIFDNINSYKIKKIIEEQDSNLKYQKKNEDIDLNNFHKNGFLFLNNFFPIQELENLKKEISYNVKKNNSITCNYQISENSVPDKILKNDKINTILKGYLGVDAKLDFMEINKIELNPVQEIISEKWHYDVVGKRIKIFVFLNDCENIFTDYAVGTNNIFHKNYSTSGSRIDNQKIKKNYTNFFAAKPVKGSVFIFDTNGFHKGSYRGANINSSKIISRETIQFEFSSKIKSEKLNKIGLDQIGTRNIFFDKNYPIENSLICKEYLTYIHNSNFYFYDRNYCSP